MIYCTIQRQAVMLAFIDNFKMLGVIFLAVIPVLVLMRKPRVPAGGVPGYWLRRFCDVGPRKGVDSRGATMATQAAVAIQTNEKKLIRARQRGDEQAVATS